MNTRCPVCRAEWPTALRKPERKIYCIECAAEKRRRILARVLDTLPSHEARMARWRQEWDALAPEEQKRRAAEAKAELWPS